MSAKDENFYKLCQQTIDGKLSIREFSILIKKSYRQCQRIVTKVAKHGMLGVKHGNCNREPHNKTSALVVEDIRSLLKNDYYDFNLTHFREMLIEKEGIKVGKNIIHRVARLHGLVKRTKRRSSKRIRKPRASSINLLSSWPHLHGNVYRLYISSQTVRLIGIGWPSFLQIVRKSSRS